MEDYIDKYIEASGADKSIRKEFDGLAKKISVNKNGLGSALLQIQKGLDNLGFSYDSQSFTAQDVVLKKKGNCLGRPLLTMSLLQNAGYTPKMAIVVNPYDAYHPTLEREFFNQLENELRYDSPRLENEQDSTDYRFVISEHLAINDGQNLFETTASDCDTKTEDYLLKGGESVRNLDFEEALSCVLKDRSLYNFKEGNLSEAIKLSHKGLQLWPNNRELHSLLASIYQTRGKYGKSKQHVRKYEELGGNDSYFYFQRYLQTGDTSFLDESLKRYPSFAFGLGWKATNLVDKDPREARYLFALASKLYAHSSLLDIEDFYITYLEGLKKVFGKDRIKKNMLEFVKN